jgi:RND family efflux transporter MFP subunit
MDLKYFLIIVILFFSLLFHSCGSDEQQAKSMEEIKTEEGIPVRVNIIDTQPFEKYYSFFSKLHGIRETTKAALIGGRIEKINVRVGDYVRQNQVIIEFDETNPGLQYEQAKTAFHNAERTYERLKALLEVGETSQANFDAAETQYLVAKRNYEALKQVLNIEAPFDGVVVDIKVNPGDNVKNEAHLFTVAQLHKMRARLWASESEIRQIKRGMTAEMIYNEKKYTGKVVDVSLAADPFKQAFYAEVEFDNPKRELKSGVVADIKILTYRNPEAIVIPRNLVNNDDKGMFVFTVNGEIAIKKYISNGADSGLDYEVKEGLTKGDKLVVQGGAFLDDGVKVKVIE